MRHGDVGDGVDPASRLIPVENAQRIRVTFAGSTSDILPWTFKPQQREVRVLPGETALVSHFFRDRPCPAYVPLFPGPCRMHDIVSLLVLISLQGILHSHKLGTGAHHWNRYLRRHPSPGCAVLFQNPVLLLRRAVLAIV